MSAVEDPPLPGPRLGAAEATEPRPSSLPDLCPYLATIDGTWRSATAVRDHRCLAVSPPVQLAAEKQRRLCLVDRHVDCATYGAALASHASGGPGVHSRPIARMTPVILDQGHFDLRMPTLRADRLPGQAALVAVLAIVFVAILLARPSGDGGAIVGSGASATDTAGASGAPTAVAAASPSVVAATQAPQETAQPAVTEPPATSTPVASQTPSPASSEPATSGDTYRVKSGDTLYAIAARFNTTTRVLIQLNGITDPSKLKIGQVLKLP